MVIVKRVILKISGELFGDNNNHIDFENLPSDDVHLISKLSMYSSVLHL